MIVRDDGGNGPGVINIRPGKLMSTHRASTNPRNATAPSSEARLISTKFDVPFTKRLGILGAEDPTALWCDELEKVSKRNSSFGSVVLGIHRGNVYYTVVLF